MTGGGDCNDVADPGTGFGVVYCELPIGHAGHHRGSKEGGYAYWYWPNSVKPSLSPGQTKEDMVNHPNHYGGKDAQFEHIKVVEALGWNYWLGNATKYIWRAGKKNPAKAIEDLEKAAFYLNAEIERLKRQQEKERQNG